MANRIARAAVCGLIFTFAAHYAAFLLLSHDSDSLLGQMVGLLVTWPTPIVVRFFPADPFHGLTFASVVSVLLIDVLTIGSLALGILTLVSRPRSK